MVFRLLLLFISVASVLCEKIGEKEERIKDGSKREGDYITHDTLSRNNQHRQPKQTNYYSIPNTANMRRINNMNFNNKYYDNRPKPMYQGNYPPQSYTANGFRRQALFPVKTKNKFGTFNNANNFVRRPFRTNNNPANLNRLNFNQIPAGGKRYKTDQKLLDNIDFLHNFLNALLKMPLHYARKYSSKLYLGPTFHTIMDVYKFYISKCEQETVGCVSRTTFSMIVKKNISSLPMKKDQYNICASYRSGNIMENIWQDHINKKNTARAAKDKDKNESSIGNQITLELDVQAVKLASFTQANAFYYKTKLCFHIRVYNVATKHATCYWFSEDQNNQLQSTLTSCLIDCLTKYYLTDDKKTDYHIFRQMYGSK
ncbi:unnamed protein product [Diabrotica balteata]|uniref:Uncharacterized protein n=1 Tax=Diabrotica balteata TaxID=107213 RepID=A0A9N9XFZ3_DIABA|nr:unnamed protein product [Diabrotica balteata]